MTLASPTTLRLPYLPPWDWQQFHDHFSLRLLPGVECLDGRGYVRSFRLGSVSSWFAVRPLDGDCALELLPGPGAATLAPQLAARVRRMFGLDVDPLSVAAHFAADDILSPRVRRRPHLRLPAAFDPFEQSVRAIVGQQVSVKAAVTLTRRLVERLGEPLADAPLDGPQWLFPRPEVLATARLDSIGMPTKRVQALQRFAAVVAGGALELHIEDGVDALVKRLCELPGIGPWTAEYIALRGFGAADAFPAADLGLLKAPVWGPAGITPRQLAQRAEAWRPWRAYAALHLWHSHLG
jgi:DNA-3-methyladenine glycosylase II